jgi:hypothetical protein
MRAVLAYFRASGFTSAAVHIAIIVFAQFGLPFLFNAPPVTATVIPVDVVRLDDVTRPPPGATPEPGLETTRAAKPASPPRPPQPVPEPPKVEPAAREKLAPPPVVIPNQEPAPPVEKPKPPKPDLAPQILKVLPKAKPKPPELRRNFSSVLKDLAANEKSSKVSKLSRKPEPVAKKGEKAPQQSLVSERASIRELDRLGNLIRSQISPCWSPPSGARDADTLQVSLEIAVDPKGNVIRVSIVDEIRITIDRSFQSAAEAARRAVLKCTPLNLPAEHYDIWKEIKFNFDPSKMLS